MIRKLPKFLKLPTWLVALLLIPYIFLLPRAAGRDDIKVLGVIDGDTIVLDGKVRLRLRHLDAPELEFCGGQEAKNLLTDLLESGWARYHSDQTSQTEAIQAAANAAKEKRLGIYSEQCYQKANPDNPQCNIKANIDKSTKVKKYYLPNCVQYQFTIVEKDIGEAWFCTEAEAQAAGFTRAATCK